MPKSFIETWCISSTESTGADGGGPLLVAQRRVLRTRRVERRVERPLGCEPRGARRRAHGPRLRCLRHFRYLRGSLRLRFAPAAKSVLLLTRYADRSYFQIRRCVFCTFMYFNRRRLVLSLLIFGRLGYRVDFRSCPSRSFSYLGEKLDRGKVT